VSNQSHQRKGNGVRSSRLWAKLPGCENTVIEDIGWDEDSGDGTGLHIVVHVRPRKRLANRCGLCGKKRPGYDQGEGRRRWRALDLGTVRAHLEADAPRVTCPDHGVITAAVPWARHGAAHTRCFDDQVAWLAAACSKTAVTALMRISWRTVGVIIVRVCAEAEAATDRFAGLRRIGIDEISYRRGHKYLVIVVDHDSGRLIWAAPDRGRATVRAFFGALGPERSKLLTHVSADGAGWIADPVRERAPQAVLCADPFHVVGWATEALDQVRREVWRAARQAGAVKNTPTGGRALQLSTGDALALRRARYPLWKNPENLTGRQQAKLAWIEITHPYLYRAYLLKEGLRTALKLKGEEARYALERWLAWAARCRIPEFITLGRRIRNHLDTIYATIDHGLSNGLIESVNTKIRVITRMAFGFHNPHALIALAMLAVGGLRPALPGR
jgi:transposase